MYGIVNKAIQDLICENHGAETWLQVKEKSGVTEDVFLSNHIYPDDTTFQLAITAAEILSIDLQDLLKAFGEYWILTSGIKTYGPLLKAGGSTIKEFLINLPNFHNRVMLIYPKLTPPEFKITDITENSLHVHYFSTRTGLQSFMIGLLQGIGKMFAANISVQVIHSRSAENNFDTFKVIWH